MKFYERHILPRIVNASCSAEAVGDTRSRIVPDASGRVLDVGFGSGLNLPFYDTDRVDHVWALEPSREMWKLAQQRINAHAIPVEFVNATAEELPLEDESVDTVLLTYTLCTIPDVVAALEQISRVLKKDGRLLFVEHGASPDEKILRWQHRIEPLWMRLAGGCHLTRRTPNLLEAGNFQIHDLSSGYIPGWKIGSFVYSGSAVPTRQTTVAVRGASATTRSTGATGTNARDRH